MMDKIGKITLHPFFMAVYPILFLLSYNISQINPQQAIRPLTISLAVALVLTLVLGIAAKDLRQGGLTVSLILALFFTYGHVHRWLEDTLPMLANHALLGAVWIALLFLGLHAKYKIRNIGKVTLYLNIILFFLLLPPLTQIGSFLWRSGIPEKIKPPSPFDNIQQGPQTKQDLPDIYYIILDAYGRTDVVQELFGYDNSSFTDYLKQRGFYVAEQSHSNYIQTALSLSSSMNLDYLGNLEGTDIQSENRDALAELIHHSQLRTFLEEQGYQTVAFSTPYGPTTLADADVFFPYNAQLGNDLESLILVTSATRALGDKMQNLFIPLLCDAQRGGTLNVFENLKRVPELPGPKFVFAHISSPHPPFVFDAEGNPAKYGECNGLDGSLFDGSDEDYRAGYPQQMVCINKITQEIIDDILAKSEIPPIIIIQGDHGSGLLLDWNSSKNTCLRERISILNAYYIPSRQDGQLYDSITPVNSFRVVLNDVFGLQLPLLEDRSYYSTWDLPYQVEDVTDKIETTCSGK